MRKLLLLTTMLTAFPFIGKAKPFNPADATSAAQIEYISYLNDYLETNLSSADFRKLESEKVEKRLRADAILAGAETEIEINDFINIAFRQINYNITQH